MHKKTKIIGFSSCKKGETVILYISYKKNAVKKRRLPAIYAEKRDLSSAESRFAYEQTAFHFGAFAVKQSSGRRMARVMSRRVPAYAGIRVVPRNFISVPFSGRGFLFSRHISIKTIIIIGGIQNEKAA